MTEQSVKLPTFDGKPTKFTMFWMRFKAYGAVKGFLPALQDGGETDMPTDEATTLDPNNPDEARQIAAKKRNAVAVASLTMAFTTQALMKHVTKSCDDDWPGGLAHLIVRSLFAKYRPQDNITKVELRMMLNKVSMKANEEPDKLFEQLGEVTNYDTSNSIDDADLMAVVFTVAPQKYQSVLSAVQLEKKDSLTLEDLEAAMDQVWRQNTAMKGKSGGANKDDELALTSRDGVQKTRNYKFKGHCNKCGKYGHKEVDCWLDPKNADKRPKNYKIPSEVANTTADAKSKELQLVNTYWGKYSEAFEDDDSVDFEAALAEVKNAKSYAEVAKMVPKKIVSTETMLKASKGMELLEDPEIFIIDTGASTHSTGNKKGLIDAKSAKGATTKVGNGESMRAESIGTLPFETQDGTKGSMSGVQYIPNSPFNLISGTKLLKLGFELRGKGDEITYTKGDAKLTFDIKIPTPEGMILAARLKRTAMEVGGVNKEEKLVSIGKAHDMLGHMGESTTRQVARHLGWSITKGSLGACEDCAIGKAKQKKVHVVTPKEKHKEVNGRIFLDLTRIVGATSKIQPLRPNWCMIVDEKTGFKTSSFHETKDDMVVPTCEKMKKWEEKGNPVQTIRMDNAGENKKLVKALNSKAWKMYPTIEYTARDTPQHNYLAEVSITTIYGRARSMMKQANVPKDKKHIVAQKAIETATKLDALIPVTLDGVTKARVEHFEGAIPGYAMHLRTWGEAGVVKTKTKTTAKLEDRGKTCMFVGYAADHAGDCYEMLDLKTRRITHSRDIQWLGRQYFRKDDGNQPTDATDDEDPSDEENLIDDFDKLIEVEPALNEDENSDSSSSENTSDTESDDDDNDHEEQQISTRSGRTIRPPMRLISEINGALVHELMAVGAGIGGGFLHTSDLVPMKYKEAMRKDPKGWRKAVREEYERMEKHRVWIPVPKQQVSKDAKILTSTWAMKQKASGVYRARLNARGYEQEPGEHFDETSMSSPTVNEASIVLILILLVMARMYAELNDVKGAFLNGTFSRGEKLFMHVPEGFEEFYPSNVFLLLLKTIYGLRQAAIEYWRALLIALRQLCLRRSKADPCVYFRWTQNGLMIWSSWVDDILSCGNKKDVIEGREALKKHFELDEIGELTEYVGCKVEYNREKGWLRMTQPVLLQSFQDEFELPKKTFRTPAAPGTVLRNEEDNKLNEKMHRDYRKGVGKLIHLSKYTKPAVLNAVRELARFGGSPSQVHYEAMLRCMKYCVDKAKDGLMIKPNATWNGKDKNFLFEIDGLSDSTFASCPDTRKSVGGWTARLQGVPYTRKSKMQKFVTLSVTEAECVAATNCVQDMMFGKNFLESLGLKVKLPMTLYMDNKGGVDIFNNWSIAGHTRAVAIRFAYIRELKEEGILIVKWIQGAENPADLFTKNLDGATFEKHASVFHGSDEYTKEEECWDDDDVDSTNRTEKPEEELRNVEKDKD